MVAPGINITLNLVKIQQPINVLVTFGDFHYKGKPITEQIAVISPPVAPACRNQELPSAPANKAISRPKQIEPFLFILFY